MIRIISVCFIIFTILVTTASCVLPQHVTLQTSPQQTTQQSLTIHPAYDAQYIRTDGYHSDMQSPVVTVIRSVAELTAYYQTNKDLYDLERRSSPASDSTIGFLDVTDKYNDDYFKNNRLLLILVQESSGSNRLNVTNIVQKDAGLDILVDRLVPEIGTTDMAQWHILVELNSIELDQASIRICFNQEPKKKNRLELVSQGITYQLIEHWVYSVKNGVSADGKWFDKLALEMDPALKADLAAACEIPYANDFTFFRIEPDGSDELETHSFNIYDENMELIHVNVDRLDIPSEEGLYYIAVFVSWGEKDNSSGYQYIFKTRR